MISVKDPIKSSVLSCSCMKCLTLINCRLTRKQMKNKQRNKQHENKQSSKQTQNKQASKHINKTSKEVNPRAQTQSKQANKLTNN